MSDSIKTVNLINPQYHKALKGVREAGTYLNEVTDKLDTALATLDARQAELVNIDAEYATKLAEAKKQLDYDITLHAESAFKALAVKLGMGQISSIELEALRKADRDLDTEINAAVGKAVGIAENKLKAEHKLAVAEKEAELKYLKAEVEGLQANITFLKEQLTETRTSAERMVENASGNTTVYGQK